MRQRRDPSLLSSRVERLDHHLGLSLILDKKTTAGENAAHCIYHLVETTRRAFLLREPDDAEVITLAVLDDSDNLDGKIDLFDVEDYANVSLSARSGRAIGTSYKLTVFLAHSREHYIPFLVNLDIPHTPFAPLPQKDRNFLPGTAAGDLQAQVSHRGLDPKQPGKPILPGFNLAPHVVAVLTTAMAVLIQRRGARESLISFNAVGVIFVVRSCERVVSMWWDITGRRSF